MVGRTRHIECDLTHRPWRWVLKDLAGEKKGCTTVEKGNGGIQEEEVCELEKGCRKEGC